MNTIDAIQKNYVSPGLCRQLQELGMPDQTHFFWKVAGEKGELGSDLFDEDNYYAHTRAVLSGLKMAEIIPSYTIGDMMEMLPNFCVEKVNTQYHVYTDKNFGINVVVNVRFADALAQAVIAGLKSQCLIVSSSAKTGS